MRELQIFLTENSSWIMMGIGILILLLLVIALHKINSLSKRMQRMAGNVGDCPKSAAETANAFHEADRPDTGVSQETQRAETEDAQEKLIHAVIDEVFS